MDAEDAEEREEQPSDGVIEGTGDVSAVCTAIHAGDQEQVDQPPDSQQAQSEKPDRSGKLASIVKAVRAGESHQPQPVTHHFTMRLVCCRHLKRTLRNSRWAAHYRNKSPLDFSTRIA